MHEWAQIPGYSYGSTACMYLNLNFQVISTSSGSAFESSSPSFGETLLIPDHSAT